MTKVIELVDGPAAGRHVAIADGARVYRVLIPDGPLIAPDPLDTTQRPLGYINIDYRPKLENGEPTKNEAGELIYSCED